MSNIDELNQKTIELAAINAKLLLEVREANSKTDALIAANAELVSVSYAIKAALDAQVAAGNIDLQPALDRLNEALESSSVAISEINTQDVETDESTAATTAAIANNTPGA